MEWLPIETAPRDGTRFLAFWKHGGHVIIRWINYGSGSFTNGNSDPKFGIPEQYGADWFSHWMPLPTPPSLRP